MAEVLTELQQVQQFLQGQGTMLQPGTLEQQKVAWERRLLNEHLTPQVAQGFVDAIRAGPWTEEMKRQLLEAVNTSVLRASTGQRELRRSAQHCSDFTSYLSREDQRILGSQVPAMIKIEMLANRCWRVGLHLPSEPTCRHVLAVGMHCGLKKPETPEHVYEVLQLFKRALKSLVRNGPRCPEHVVRFPGDPGNLPQAILQGAYDEDDPPVGLTVSMAELAPLEAGIPCRKASRLMTQNSRALVPVAGQPSSSSTGATGGTGDANNFQTMAMSMMAMMMNLCQGGQQAGNAGNVDLMMLNPNLRKKQPKALTNGPTEGDAGGTPLTDQQNTPGPRPAGSTPGNSPPETTPRNSPVETTPRNSPAETSPQGSDPVKRALALPDLSPLEQGAAFNAAVAQRAETKNAPQEMEGEGLGDDQGDVAEPKAKAKAKAKAKTKAKCKADAKALPGSKGKAAAKAKAKEAKEGKEGKESEGAVGKGETQKKRVLPKSERVVHPLGQRPDVMGPTDPTVYYGPGKINRNAKQWRVFAKVTDRNDKAIKIDDEQVSWIKCLEHIEACAEKSE
eukprot:Skav208657  [mRNA]  locus=scaffold357:35393:37081:- [translate_table: standard]